MSKPVICPSSVLPLLMWEGKSCPDNYKRGTKVICNLKDGKNAFMCIPPESANPITESDFGKFANASDNEKLENINKLEKIILADDPDGDSTKEFIGSMNTLKQSINLYNGYKEHEEKVLSNTIKTSKTSNTNKTGKINKNV